MDKLRILKHLYKEPKELGLYPTIEVYKLQALAKEWIDFLDKEVYDKQLKGLADYREKVIGLIATRQWIAKFFSVENSKKD